MDIIMLFAERWKMTPFEVFEKDIDDFIILSNYLLSLDAEPQPKAEKRRKETRIKVNDKTATGGWF